MQRKGLSNLIVSTLCVLSALAYARPVLADTFSDIAKVAADARDQSEKVTHPISRYAMLLKLAKIEDIVGDQAGARKSLQLAIPLQNDPRSGGYGLWDLVELWARTGDYDGAQQVVKKNIPVQNQMFVMRLIGVTAARKGDRAALSQILVEIESEFASTGDIIHHDRSLLDIGVAQATAGNVEGARVTMSHIVTSEHRVPVLAAIAKTRLEAGDIAGSHDLLSEIDRIAAARSLPGYIVTNLAQVLAEMGDINAATKALAEVTLANPHDHAVIQIVQGLCKKNATTDALTVAQLAQEPSSRIFAIIAVAMQQAKVDDRRDAIETLRAAKELALSQPFGVDYSRVINAFIRVSDFDAALDVIKVLDKRNRPQFYLEIARAQIDAKDFSGALATLKEASPLIDRTGRYPPTGWDLLALADALGKAGDMAGAQQALDDVRRNFGSSSMAYLDLQVSMGDEKGALELASKQSSGRRQDALYGVWWGELYNLGNVDKAEVVAKMLRGEKRSDALDKTAFWRSCYQASAGQYDAAVKTAASISNIMDRVASLYVLAEYISPEDRASQAERKCAHS